MNWLRSHRTLPLLALAALSLAATRSTAAPASADPESSYAAGRFDEAERGFAARKNAADDTLATLRRASLRLLRNDTKAARALAEPLLAKHAEMRSARALLLEAHLRELDFADAAPLAHALGREPLARRLESFAGATPYRLEGPPHAEVPFVLTDPLPLIEVSINGRGPYLLLIDTGGGEMIVDPVVADSLGCPKFGSENGTFGGGRRRDVELSRIDALTLGGVTIHGVPTGLLDCSHFAAVAGGRQVAGILGTRVLMQFRATLDYPGGRLVLDARGAPPIAVDSTHLVMPMWMGGDHYMLARGRLNGGPESLWFVDTGLAGASVTVPASTLVEAGMPVPDTTSAGSGIGGGGSTKLKFFPVAAFDLGAAHAGNLAGFFGPFPPTLERAFGYRIAGIISHGFFRPWRLTFDFDAMQIVLERPGRAP